MTGIKHSKIWFSIFVRTQGASMGAYWTYVPIDTTKKTDEKTNHMEGFILNLGLNQT